MKILAIETSCDDTCIAIIEVFGKRNPQFKILSNIVSSQVEIHKKWGGVYPALAKREHQKNLVLVLREALGRAKLLKKSKNSINRKEKKTLGILLEREEILFKILLRFLKNNKKPDINLIVITTGPGLEPCLWAGINFARALSYFWNLPIIPINHIESHILSNWLKIENRKSKIKFPAICLVVSGGHTQLILMKKIGSYKILGETRDDAAGECLDKVARILGLGYPGGPIVAKMATKCKMQNEKCKIRLPRPMINTKDYDFSFSGLKTAVLYLSRQLTKNNKQLTTNIKREICKETQQAIIDVLVHKILRAAGEFKAKTVILGGGVAANKELRKQLKADIIKKTPGTEYFIPDTKYCTDNAVMVAISAYFNRSKKKSWEEIKANANQRI